MSSLQSKIRVAALTHRGKVRSKNEDAMALGEKLFFGDMEQPFVAEPQDGPTVLIVADGMGGHVKGEIASRSVLEILRDGAYPDDILAWDRALSFANDRLYDLMRLRPEVIGLGSTIVGVSLSADRTTYFNVGDSRAYRHSLHTLEQVSRDDVPIPAIRNEARRTSQITQALGGRSFRTKILPHVLAGPPMRIGETILLCSDGLTDMVSDEEICKILDDPAEPSLSVQRLADAALLAGGRDNISVIVARAY